MAFDLVGQMRRLFVLHEHLVAVKPGAVVPIGPPAGDHRQFPRLTPFAGGDLKSPAAFPTEPALGRGDEQVQRKLPCVREYQVVVTVIVEVNPPQAVVMALFIDN